MADSNPSSSRQDATACSQVDGAPLTDAQRDFAKLLGRLLAQRWSEEQCGKQDTELRDDFKAETVRPSS
jgi:hypothetical protein